MALTNYEKGDLRRRVKRQIELGHDMKTAVEVIKNFGHVPSTIRKYYKALSPGPVLE